jgi:hypothetical protein
MGSSIEVLDHYYFCHLRDSVPHGLKPFEICPKGLVSLVLDGFEVPWLRRLVGEGLKVGDEAPTEVGPVVDAVSW